MVSGIFVLRLYRGQLMCEQTSRWSICHIYLSSPLCRRRDIVCYNWLLDPREWRGKDSQAFEIISLRFGLILCKKKKKKNRFAHNYSHLFLAALILFKVERRGRREESYRTCFSRFIIERARLIIRRFLRAYSTVNSKCGQYSWEPWENIVLPNDSMSPHALESIFVPSRNARRILPTGNVLSRKKLRELIGGRYKGKSRFGPHGEASSQAVDLTDVQCTPECNAVHKDTSRSMSRDRY